MTSVPTLKPSPRLGPGDGLLIFQAAAALAAASLMIAIMPFRRIARFASLSDTVTRRTPELDRTRRAAQAVDAWARRLPWKTVCFQKGLALHWMLRRNGIGSRLHYGVDRHAEHGLRAHVWVSVGSEIVMGGDVAHEFVCLATFPSDNGPAAR